MVTLRINGVKVEVEKGATLLEAAKKAGIWIPTLCHNDALTPFGGCRLCVVEVFAGGKRQTVSSCCYEAQEAIEVETDTDYINSIRRFLIELLLLESPDCENLKQLAERFDVKKAYTLEPSYEPCIACGQCVRACGEIVGVSAIDFVGRGYKKTVGTPFLRRSEECIGCGTCVAVCPTGAVTMQEVVEGEKLTMPDGEVVRGPARILDKWKTGLRMKRCSVCGETFAPERQLEYFEKKVQLADGFFDVCVYCREDKKG